MHGLSQESLRQVLLHEMGHVTERDNIRILLERCVALLFWCNPMAWLVANEIAFYREIRCDELAIESEPLRYLRTLLHVSRALVAANSFEISSAAVGSKKTFLRRAEAIAMAKAGKPLPIGSSFAACAVALVCVWITGLVAPPMSFRAAPFTDTTRAGLSYFVGHWTCFDGGHASTKIGIASFQPISSGLREENRSVGGRWTYLSTANWSKQNGEITVRGSDNVDHAFEAHTKDGAAFNVYAGVVLLADGYRDELTARNGNIFDSKAFVYSHSRWNLIQHADCTREQHGIVAI